MNEDLVMDKNGSGCPDFAAQDPATVTEHFFRKWGALRSQALFRKDDRSVLGHVEHWFARVEYQARGAPHIHMKVRMYVCV